MEITKTCSKCSTSYPANAVHFTRSSRYKDGLGPQCRNCAAQYYQIDKERRKTLATERYAKLTAEDPTHAREKSRRRREKDPEKIREYMRNYRAKNRDKFRGYAADWRANNLEVSLARQRLTEGRRRARKRGGLGVPLPDALVAKLVAAQSEKCWWCQCKLASGFHIDHRIPLAKGGTHTEGNLVVACPPCNLQKGSKMPWEIKGGRLL